MDMDQLQMLSLGISMFVVVVGFGMSIYSIHLQRTDLKLQREEVTKQNKQIIQTLKDILKAVRSLTI